MTKYLVTNVTPGHLTVEASDGRRTILDGEGLAHVEGEPDYVVYTSSIHSWSDPTPAAMTADEKEKVLSAVEEWAGSVRFKVELE
ncbi:MAG: hypothetical protein KA712_12065 [Myxococcales bacterium]|nr:hypothetical protein [Myxococcales bacterium]